MSRRMVGKCVKWEDGRLLEHGEYSKHPSGIWFGCSPNGHMANLGNHIVLEHDDGTITVSPSILISNKAGPLWHGYLVSGNWTDD